MGDHRSASRSFRHIGLWGLFFVSTSVPTLALAQAAASPFDTGAQSLLTFMLTIAAPVAAIIIIGVCIAAAMSQAAVRNPADGLSHRFQAAQIIQIQNSNSRMV